jgi:hypothetical protein
MTLSLLRVKIIDIYLFYFQWILWMIALLMFLFVLVDDIVASESKDY